jgi:DegV family protein with EDD domain
MLILTDSAADLPKEEADELGIYVAPLYIQFPDGGVSSEVISPDEFYARLKAMEPDIPTTSQPSAGLFQQLYHKLADFKDEILSIHISSGLSGTIESARLGARELLNANIEIVDSMTLSGGERFQVLAAARAVKAGWSKQAILDRLSAIRDRNEVIYTLDTLSYLARGGRIGRVQALAGSILKIKPVITVDKKDGKYNTVGKERTIQKALHGIADYLVHKFDATTPVRVTVLHGQFGEQADNLAAILKTRLNITHLEILRISPVLGVHTGPAIVGAAVVPDDLFEGLA